MKKTVRLLALLLCVACLIPLSTQTGVSVIAADGEAFYVATDGSDSASGTKDAPFATLQAAQKAVRARIAQGNLPEGGITVYLRGGEYTITEPLVMDAQDSGTAQCPITWCAYENEEVVLNGGVKVDPSLFTAAPADKKAILLDQSKASALLQLDLNKLGISGNTEVFIDGEYRYNSRYPNDTFYGYYTGAEGGGVLVDHGGHVSQWKTTEGICVRGYLEIDYFEKTGQVTKIEGDYVTLNTTVGYYPRYYFYNILDEVDMPGEYYIDAKTNIMYILPTENFADADILLTRLGNEKGSAVFCGKGTQYNTFRGFTVEGANISAFVFEESRGITVDGVEICNLVDDAVRINGFENRVVNCELYNLLGAGITMGGSDQVNMIPGNNLVDNNHIHHFSLGVGTYQGGVNISSSWDYGITVSHNLIHDTKHLGINGGSSDCIVEYNVIYNVCTEAADAGAIYTGRYEAQEQIYRYNLIYNVGNLHGWGEPHGIYVDDGGSFKICYGNIFYNVVGDSFAIGGGTNNQIYNNIMIGGGTGVAYDSRQMLSQWETHYAEYPDGMMWSCLFEAKGYKTRNWMMRYPRVTLIDISNNRDERDRWALGVVGPALIRGNAFVGMKQNYSFEGPSFNYIDVRDNAYYTDISAVDFADADNFNFALLESSAIYNDICSFAEIPVDQMGLRK